MSMLSRRLLRPLPRLARAYASTPQPPAPIPSKQPSEAVPFDLQQSPNVPSTWSTSQNPKPNAFDNARFEQTALDLQPDSLSAMGMVEKDPVRLVEGRRATCDGGKFSSGALSGVARRISRRVIAERERNNEEGEMVRSDRRNWEIRAKEQEADHWDTPRSSSTSTSQDQKHVDTGALRVTDDGAR